MPDLGLNVLFKGKNLARLLGGLGVALKISLLSVVISIVLGIVVGLLMTWKNPISRALMRCYLEIVRNIRMEPLRRDLLRDRLFLLGSGRDGRPGARRADQHPPSSI